MAAVTACRTWRAVGSSERCSVDTNRASAPAAPMLGCCIVSRMVSLLDISWLAAGLRSGAADTRVDAHVVEGTGEDRHRHRAGPAAVADRPVVIAALPGGDGAD